MKHLFGTPDSVMVIRRIKQTLINACLPFNIPERVRQLGQFSIRSSSPTKLQVLLLTSLVITGGVLGVRQIGGLQPLELAIFDQMTRLRRDRGPDPRLLVVTITEADIRSQKRWPLSDQVVAQVLDNLQQYQPTAIGVDIFRDIPNEPGNLRLTEQLKQPNVVVVTYLGNSQDERIAAPPTIPEERVGFNDIVIDPDGVVRRSLLFASNGKTILSSFSLQLALMYLERRCLPIGNGATTGNGTPSRERATCQPILPELTKSQTLRLGKTVFTRLKSNSGGYQTIDARGYQTLLNYRSALGGAEQITLQQVLQKRFDPNLVRGRVVLIGTSAPSNKDLFYTPYSFIAEGNRQMPGVLVHAQMVSQIFSTVLDDHPLIWFWSERLEILWIVIWVGVGSLLTWRIQRLRVLAVASLGAAAVLLGICFGIFTQSGWIPVVPPMLALLATVSSSVVYKLLHQTFHDALTGLPNRTLFLRRLQSVISRARQECRAQAAERDKQETERVPLVAVLFLDLDRFKMVNDSLGHKSGDYLLVHASRRLRACLRPTDALARVGGDEFAILLDQIRDVTEITQVADHLQQEMTIPFQINNQDIFTSVSIGIALNRADYNYEPEDLLRDAHTAMYQAKAMGKARHEVFARGMRVQVVKRLQLETDLRRALDEQEFQLYYQPIVSLKTGKLVGFEALIRWQHWDRGFIPPIEFIPVAEETGLIIPLGQWIFQTACQQLRQWQAQFAIATDLMISINLSGQQFKQPDLVDFIEHTLKATGIPGHNLKLEITESIAMHDVEASISLLLRLRALNLQLSIDDFGTGYSSLSYLHRFPVTTLKVDQSFVSRMDDTGEDAAIVRTIILLAHSLGMDVVAEGVETATQRSRLQTLNCEYGQGYFFSRPLDVDSATQLLASNADWI